METSPLSLLTSNHDILPICFSSIYVDATFSISKAKKGVSAKALVSRYYLPVGSTDFARQIAVTYIYIYSCSAEWLDSFLKLYLFSRKIYCDGQFQISWI